MLVEVSVGTGCTYYPHAHMDKSRLQRRTMPPFLGAAFLTTFLSARLWSSCKLRPEPPHCLVQALCHGCVAQIRLQDGFVDGSSDGNA